MTTRKLASIKIVTPSFNQGKYLRQTIKSILSQNDPQVQYWVIDGGSTDQTVKILRSFGKQLKWISKKDKGQTDAINRGIRKLIAHAKDSDIFAYINSDDYYLPETFFKVRSAFEKHPKAMWLVGDAKIVDGRGREIQTWVRRYKSILRLFPFSLLVTNPFPQPSVFIKVKALKKIGLFNEKLSFTMDYDYWLRLYRMFGWPLILNDTFSAFRIHSSSKGGSQFKRQFEEEYRVFKHYYHDPLMLILHRVHTSIVLLIYSLVK